MRKTSVKKTIATGLATLALFGAFQVTAISADESSGDELSDLLATRAVPSTVPEKDTSTRDSIVVPTQPAPSGIEAALVGYTFVPISPYRTYDSRSYFDGFLFGGDEVIFDVITDQFDVPKIPSTAVAVTYNLTVTSTGGSGYLAIYPASIVWPGNSSINWTSTGQTIANGGTVAVGNFGGPGRVAILCGPVGLLGTDFLLDITGYYI